MFKNSGNEIYFVVREWSRPYNEKPCHSLSRCRISHGFINKKSVLAILLPLIVSRDWTYFCIDRYAYGSGYPRLFF
jgi:hypothetical protein